MDTKKPYIKAGLMGGLIGAVLGVLGSIPFINCLALPFTFLGFFVVPMGTGYYSAMLSGNKTQYEDGAKNGLFAGLVMGGISGVVSYVLSIVMSLLGMSLGFGSSMLGGENALESSAAAASFGVTGFMSVLVFGLCFLVIGIFLNAGFGALGGVLYVALNENKEVAKVVSDVKSEVKKVVTPEEKKPE